MSIPSMVEYFHDLFNESPPVLSPREVVYVDVVHTYIHTKLPTIT